MFVFSPPTTPTTVSRVSCIAALSRIVGPCPSYLVPLGRTVGLPMNGAVSNLGLSTQAVGTLGRELRSGGYDVVHVHEPNAPFVSWFATEAARVPLVGTFHCYSRNPVSERPRRQLGRRATALQQAARADRGVGGRALDLRALLRRYATGSSRTASTWRRPGPRTRTGANALEILFVGRAEARKGLPVLLRAFEALRGAGVQARLTVAGATDEEVAPLLLDPEGVRVVGRVSDEEKWRLLGESDLLCAPSLGGESFGMVLTEAFASATPVVASDIAGYRDVVRDGFDGLLVPAADPAALGEALCDLALDPARRAHDVRRPHASGRSASRGRAWRTRSSTPTRTRWRCPRRSRAPSGPRRDSGLATADPGPAVRPQRLASIEPDAPPARRRTAVRVARRAAVLGAAAGGIGLAALALDHIGIESIGRAVVAATPGLGAHGVRAHVRVDAASGRRRGTRSCAPPCRALEYDAATPRAPP